MTPRCAAAVISAVVLRRPTKEYTHRYSMMHRGLTTAGIEVAPHYHQLLVRREEENTDEYYSCTYTSEYHAPKFSGLLTRTYSYVPASCPSKGRLTYFLPLVLWRFRAHAATPTSSNFRHAYSTAVALAAGVIGRSTAEARSTESCVHSFAKQTPTAMSSWR